MKKLLLCSLLALCFSFVHSQTKEINGSQFTFKKSNETLKWISQYINIGNDGDYNYSLKYIFNKAAHNVAPKVFLVKRDENYSIIKETRINFHKDRLKFQNIDSYHMFGGKLICLGKRKNKETKKEEVMVIEYDKSSLEEKNIATISSLNPLIKGKKAYYNNLVVFDKKIKENELLISMIGSSKEGRIIKSIIINEQLENIFEGKININNSKGRYKFEDASYTDNTISYLIYRDKYGDKMNYSHIYLSRNTDNKSKQIPITLEEGSELSAQSIINNELINILGVIKNKKSGGKVYSYIYDIKSDKIILNKSQDIDNFKGGSQSELILNKIVKNKTGDFIIIAENMPPNISNDPQTSVSIGKKLISVPDKRFKKRNDPLRIIGENLISEGLFFVKIRKNGEFDWTSITNKYTKAEKQHYDHLTLIKDYTESIHFICYSQNQSISLININKETGEVKTEQIFKETRLLGTDKFDIGTPIEVVSNKWIVPFGNIEYVNKGVLEVKFNH